MKKAVFLSLIITLAVFAVDQSYNFEQSQEAEVVRVIDGDTIEVNFNGRDETVRFIGMDTPEIHGGNNPEYFEGVPDDQKGEDCLLVWAQKSTEYVEKQLDKGEKVELIFEGDRRDQYGRLRAHIHLADHENSLNYKLVREGYANVFPVEFSDRNSFEEAEKQAQEKNKGLWTCRN